MKDPNEVRQTLLEMKKEYDASDPTDSPLRRSIKMSMARAYRDMTKSEMLQAYAYVDSMVK